MSEMEEFLAFLESVNWAAVVVSLLLFAVTIWLGIWLPGKVIERHTNQPVARYVWYGVGSLALVMIYLAAYGYGLFWNILAKDPSAIDGGRHSTLRQ
jgi:hypothetical protein